MKKIFVSGIFVAAAAFLFFSILPENDEHLLYPESVMDGIASIEISGGGTGEVFLEDTVSGWRLKEKKLLMDCNQDRVNEFLDNLANSHRYNTAGRGEEVWNSLGVDQAGAVMVRVSGKNGAAAVYYGKRIPGTERIFVRTDGSREVYEADYPGDMIYADKWFWVRLGLFEKTVNPENVINIAVRNGESGFTILRKVSGGKSVWEMVLENKTVVLDSRKVDLFLDELCSYRGRYVAAEEPDEKLPFIGSISITESSGKVCGLVFYGASDTKIFVRRKEGGYLYTTGTAEMRRVLLSPVGVLNRF